MSDNPSASSRIDAKIAALGDWRGDVLQRVRTMILDAEPGIEETVKWVKPTNPSGVPVWEYAGIVCTGEVYRAYVKLTFAHGASLDDPVSLFNASLTGGTRRAIDIREHQAVDARRFTQLVKSAVAFNVSRASRGPR